VQAGLEYNAPGAHAISTALGYNQLLTTNSVELLAEEGAQFIKTLQASAATFHGPEQDVALAKIKALQTMVALSTCHQPEDSEGYRARCARIADCASR